MPRQYGSARIDCPVCMERVYPLEATAFEGKTYHKGCMKCTHCNNKVSIKGVAVIDGNLYCKPHFIELFKSGGGQYDAFSSPKPSMTSPPKSVESTPETATKEKPEKEEVQEVEPESKAEPEVVATPPSKAKRESVVIPPDNDREDESDIAKTLQNIKQKSKRNVSSGDIFKDLKMRNIQSLKKTIADGGVDTIFQEGPDGSTPIEFAFKANNQECGRYMVQYLQDHIKNGGN